MKDCKYCGKPLYKGARYCAYCGNPTEEFPTTIRQEDLDVGNRVILCKDGKYRWIYELHMLKNPTIFYDVLTVLGMSAAIVAAFVLILDIIVSEGSS